MAKITTVFPNSVNELSDLVLSRKKILIKGAGTSTVVPFGKIDQLPQDDTDISVVCLDKLPKKIIFDEAGFLTISGPVSWEEARHFLFEKKYEIPLWPTETSAHILSGIATSASGERSFRYGPLRNYILKLKVINHKGEICEYFANEIFLGPKLIFSRNTNHKFKNELLPVISSQVDPFIGTEGQFGIIVECQLKLVPKVKTLPFFVLLPAWDKFENYKIHLQVLSWVKKQQNIYSCEFMDHHSLDFVTSSRFKNLKMDIVFFEVEASGLDEKCQSLLSSCSDLLPDNIGQIELTELMALRLEIPRKVADFISHSGLQKKGTDVQVSEEDFDKLLSAYKVMAELLTMRGQVFLLFGHFGDCHLHFNILPSKEQSHWSENLLEIFYDKIMKLSCMPFAEHGIGVLKQKYWFKYVSIEDQKNVHKLKSYFDPENIFNPIGNMSKIKI